MLKRTSAEEIRQKLAQRIIAGELQPGTPLDETTLAGEYDVSRTPVREALQQLAARGLVRIAPRQGVFVSRLSVNRVRAMLEYIGELESLCAKLAARRLDGEVRRALDAAVAQCEEAAEHGASAEYAVANTVFHEAVYAGCRNEYLAEQIRQARRLIQRYRVRDFQTKAQIAASLADHRKIAQAIQSGDEALAAETMLLHVPAGTTGFSEFLAKVPMSFFETDSGADA